jgi:hypothetical protein
MYVDESGHHTLKGDLSEEANRFLCLTGVIMRIEKHKELTARLDALKLDVFCTSDIVLHRRELVSKKPPFEALKDKDLCARFDSALIKIIDEHPYGVISVVIDKLSLVERYGERAQNPYALALEWLMQRYQYWMQDFSAQTTYRGDILIESRGKKEDRDTKATYTKIYLGQGSTPLRNATDYYSSREIKLEKKSKNIAGLQLADILCHAARRHILSDLQLPSNNRQENSFGQEICAILTKLKYPRDMCS